MRISSRLNVVRSVIVSMIERFSSGKKDAPAGVLLDGDRRNGVVRPPGKMPCWRELKVEVPPFSSTRASSRSQDNFHAPHLLPFCCGTKSHDSLRISCTAGDSTRLDSAPLLQTECLVWQ